MLQALRATHPLREMARESAMCNSNFSGKSTVITTRISPGNMAVIELAVW